MVLFPQEEKPSIAIIIFFMFRLSYLFPKDTFILKIDHAFGHKTSEVVLKELKILKNEEKEVSRRDTFIEKNYICNSI
ncbi:hypothetical protein EVA_05389 [gut metagenome]|uniref:Uncharacterized protein n=1 Tax=gut metagenome TaxID=749906 RepID=J9GUL6_9ZZZZ